MNDKPLKFSAKKNRSEKLGVTDMKLNVEIVAQNFTIHKLKRKLMTDKSSYNKIIHD